MTINRDVTVEATLAAVEGLNRVECDSVLVSSVASIKLSEK